MAKGSILSEGWSTIKEIDLKPIQQQALGGVKLALVGKPGSGRTSIARQMRIDPARSGIESNSPVQIIDIQNASEAVEADLIILVVNPEDTDTSRGQKLLTDWANSGKKTLVFINYTGYQVKPDMISPWTHQRSRGVVHGSASDPSFMMSEFASKIITLLPDKLLGIARDFPLFRSSVAHYLINDTCLSNAAYSLSTGIAETIGVFDLPITLADMVVLTKNQAYLVYKLGLMLGYSIRWQDYVTEFGSVLGTSFLWRQLARSLVGLIPVWGIIPKVAISYAGTYVVGHVVLQWYLTGRHINRKQMEQLYRQALVRGQNIARDMIQKRPRLIPPRKKPPLLAAPKGKQKKVCSYCGKPMNDSDNFCKNCGMPYSE